MTTRYLARTIACAICGDPVHDGDHEALFTIVDGTEEWVMTGHRACIRAEVNRRNGVQES